MPNVHFLVRFFAKVLTPRSKQLSSGTPPSSIYILKMLRPFAKIACFVEKKVASKRRELIRREIWARMG